MHQGELLVEAVASILLDLTRIRGSGAEPYEPWVETLCGTCGQSELNVEIFGIGGNPIINLGYVYTPPLLRNQGHAKFAIRAILKIADEYGVAVILKPEPQDDHTSKWRLEDYYFRLGFRSSEGVDTWTRASRKRDEPDPEELEAWGITAAEYYELRRLS